MALSTLYYAHRSYGPLFVSCDGHEVPLLNRTQLRVRVLRIRLVPVEAGKIFLRPGILKNFSVPRVNFIAHLAHVFDKQPLQQRGRDRLRADLVMQFVFESDDGFDVGLVSTG